MCVRETRKLHRIISKKDLDEGDELRITVANWFPVDKFGKKYVAIGTTTWAGLDNYDLAWVLLSVSIISISTALLFGGLLLFKTRKLAEIDRYKWHNRPKTHSLITVA